MSKSTFTEDEALSLISFSEQLIKDNKIIDTGIQAANNTIERFENDVERFKSLLNPLAKVGHQKLLKRCLEASEWDLQTKRNELSQLEDSKKYNETFIKAIKLALSV